MKEELKVIMDLMEDLQSKMEMGEGDFSERLGREKPKIAAIEIGVGKPMDDEIPEMEGDMDGEEFAEEELGPDDKLKQRLMKLRG